eukprot:3323302-Alexandrium_andersonii.AAC.1
MRWEEGAERLIWEGLGRPAALRESEAAALFAGTSHDIAATVAFGKDPVTNLKTVELHRKIEILKHKIPDSEWP